MVRSEKKSWFVYPSIFVFLSYTFSAHNFAFAEKVWKKKSANFFVCFPSFVGLNEEIADILYAFNEQYWKPLLNKSAKKSTTSFISLEMGLTLHWWHQPVHLPSQSHMTLIFSFTMRQEEALKHPLKCRTGTSKLGKLVSVFFLIVDMCQDPAYCHGSWGGSPTHIVFELV